MISAKASEVHLVEQAMVAAVGAGWPCAAGRHACPNHVAEHTAPELLYLESKFASLVSYGLTADLLQEVLPVGTTANAFGCPGNVDLVMTGRSGFIAVGRQATNATATSTAATAPTMRASMAPIS